MFNLTHSAMSFINPSLTLERRYPDGVTYYSCPFFNASVDPILAVRPDDPIGGICRAEAPSTIERTHGGFHRETSLVTSNVIGLLSQTWTLGMSLRQMGDGHVITIGTMDGHMISLYIRNGEAVLFLGQSGGDSTSELSGGMLEEGVFTPVVNSIVRFFFF